MQNHTAYLEIRTAQTAKQDHLRQVHETQLLSRELWPEVFYEGIMTKSLLPWKKGQVTQLLLKTEVQKQIEMGDE